MRFYAACLASYNAGTLHGAWIDASTDVDAMQEEINAMLRASPHPNVLVEHFETAARNAGWHDASADGRLPISRNRTEAENAARADNDGPTLYAESWEAACEHDGLSGEVPSAEEWAIHDYANVPSTLGEFPGLATIAAYVELIEAADDKDIPADVAAELADSWRADDIDRAKDTIEDEYQGCFDSLEDWAVDFEAQTGGLEGVPKHLENYIDFKAIGRDAELGGDIRALRGADGSLYVFWNR